jgi:nucleotide-binding universal stress UspA family protein
MYDDILIPTDGSDASKRAVEHAIDMARTYDARLHALYVVDTGAYSTLDVGAEMLLDALEEEGEATVKRVEEMAGDAGVSVSTEIASGTPHRTILDYAEDHDVDLIVMGTHGRTGLDRYLLGSVTERVVRTADVPVLTVRTGREDRDEE